MVRRTREEAIQTRESILDAAEDVFREKGVSRSSLEEVARRAGCTRGAVYWHFANKRDLLLAMCRRMDATIAIHREQMQRAAVDDPIGALRDFLRYIVGDLLRDPHARKVLDIIHHRCEYVDEMREFTEILDNEFDSKHQEIEQLFACGQSRGQVRADLSPKLCAKMTHSLLTGILHDSLQDAGPNRRFAAFSNMQVVDFLFESLGYRAAACV